MLMVTMLTELTYQTMYIHLKSTYKIKVGHKRCVFFLFGPPLLCLTLINIALTNCALTI